MATPIDGLYLAEPLWLWALLLPLPLWWWPRARRSRSTNERLRRYADAHLLPHLLSRGQSEAQVHRRLALWTLLWALGVVAMAGPRLGYRDVDLLSPGTDLLVLFDLSASMGAKDVKPSRIARARQEVEDLLDAGRDIRVGLMGFASVAHLVAPITDDDETLLHLLPSLNTDLVRWRGSRLANALERARRIMLAQPKESGHAVLLVTDGDFTEPGLEDQARMMLAQGMRLYVLGVGTPEGGRVPGPRGGWLRDSTGREVVSPLDEGALRRLAKAGGGRYLRAEYRDSDTRQLLDDIGSNVAGERRAEGVRRVWHERFDWLVVPMLLLLLLWWRRALVPRRLKRQVAR